MSMIARSMILVICMNLLIACSPVRPLAAPAEFQMLPEEPPIYTNEAVYVTEQVTPGQGEGLPDRGGKEGLFPVIEYVQDELLLIGREADIDALFERVAEDELDLVLEPQPAKIGGVVIDAENRDNDIYAAIFQFAPKEIGARQAVDIIREIVDNSELPVFVDLNYVAGVKAPLRDDDVCAHPMSGEASPMSGEASPYTDTITTMSDMVELFWGQWALGPSAPESGGINLVENGERRDDVSTGAGRSIYILDTSPFTQTGRYTFGEPAWFTPTMALTVTHPVSATLTPTGGVPPCAMADHGLFVAGLAYAVAPEAELNLIRVLNGAGKGDLGGILAALYQLTQKSMTNSVVNMSFGLTPNSLPPGVPPLEAVCRQLARELGVDPVVGPDGIPEICNDIRAVFRAWLNTKPPSENARNVLYHFGEPMLALLLSDLQDEGAVMAAAAGNKSNLGHMEPAELPASYGIVSSTGSIPFLSAMLPAVAGTSHRERASYSNNGAIMAPGGGDNDSDDCLTASFDVKGDGCWDDPEDFVVSLMRYPDSTSDYTFGLWVGTSFATPLVAGKATVAMSNTVTADLNAIAPSLCPTGDFSLDSASPQRPAICFP